MSAIDDKYAALGGASGWLGSPTQPESSTPDSKGRFRHYQNGSIYWSSATGAHEVHGSIRQKWASLGWETGFLGYPVTDESATPDTVGRFNHFQGGSIYWTPTTGAHEVHGSILAKGKELGWEKSFLGYPLTDEMTTPDGLGRYNHFQGGAIYWSAATAAYEVRGSTRSHRVGLRGFADLHTHPMSHLGFGGKLIHGAPDVGVLVPAIPSGNGCRHYERAASINEALSTCRSTHGGFGFFDNTCGDDLRKLILRGTESNLHVQTAHHEEGARGFPEFKGWPAFNDITHQQMWIDWIKRTYQNGLRVMVALTVNNATLAAAVSGSGDRNPDDVSSSNIQIDEIKRMVARHNGSAGSVDNWMEIAYSASDVRRIVDSGRLAVILGMEVDNIGNFHKNDAVNANNVTPVTAQLVRDEIRRIYHQGVRYIFPVHLVDNKLSGVAVYEDMFNLSNYHQTGRYWDIVCANPTDEITKKFVVAGFDAALAAAKTKIGVDPFRNPPTPPDCGAVGHVNNLGLTPLGEFAIKEMMKLGMMIDVDHMSKKAMDKTLEIARTVVAGGYPVNSGHNGIRVHEGSERSLDVAQAQTIMKLGGMIGVGCSKTPADQFARNFTSIVNTLGATNARLAIGTDINGFEQAPPPRPGSNVQYNTAFPICQTGSASWDYNKVGVAHYGLLPDFLCDANGLSNLRIFDNYLMKSTEYFAQMWERVEMAARQINNPTPTRLVALRTLVSGHYLYPEGAAGQRLLALANEITLSETFEMIELGGNKVAFRARNGKLIHAGGGGGGAVLVAPDAIGAWETFERIDLGNGIIALKVANGQYLSAEMGGGQEVVANRSQIGDWEKFVVMGNPLLGTPAQSINAWSQIEGSLKHVAVGYNGETWGVNADDLIFRWNGRAWALIPGKLKQISVGNAGEIWGVNAIDEIFKRKGDGWELIPGKLKHVSVGSDGTVWGVNANDDIVRRHAGNWFLIPGRLKQISVGSVSEIWGVNKNDEIFRWTGSAWTLIPGLLKYVSVGSDGTVWGVNAGDDIYRLNGNEWVRIPGKLKQISVGAINQIWGVNAANQIFKGR